MNLDFYLPVRLLTGRGCVPRHAGEFRKLGGRCLIVTSPGAGRKSGALGDVEAALNEQGIPYEVYDKVRQNPLLSDCKEAGEQARSFGAEFLVGIGGGSPLDSAKAAAVYAANNLELLDIYKMNWPNPPLPTALVGTTAGTGSEVGPVAVLTRPDGRKMSVSGDLLYARIAFGDPGYTDSLPVDFTVSTALDALSHAVEGYFSTQGNTLSDLYAAEAVSILVPELRGLQGKREFGEIAPETRDRLYYASVLAGFTLARCGTCYCHSLGYFLSERYHVPHGMACAATLSHFIRRADRLMPDRFAALTRRTGQTARVLCEIIESLLSLPPVSLTAEEIREQLDRFDGSNNFLRTAPAGFSRREAEALLTEQYGN